MSGLWTQLGIIGAAIVGFLAYIGLVKRNARKETLAKEAERGTAVRVEVETKHANDTTSERIDRLRKARRAKP